MKKSKTPFANLILVTSRAHEGSCLNEAPHIGKEMEEVN